MNRTQRFEQQEVQDALDREQHEPTHPQKAGRMILEITDTAQQGYDAKS